MTTVFEKINDKKHFSQFHYEPHAVCYFCYQIFTFLHILKFFINVKVILFLQLSTMPWKHMG